ncbi:hypothetical protein B0H17DRAFT_1018509 [Mycena rosella]|uniref:Uncharacterized protein n=1 Tax=Mycena rosella TaxID=1033263 RepID=A0AAD7CXU8_MYCRO|nr:hypothetical protein B0H17DRAFT_1018509 [Mycena rosella]
MSSVHSARAKRWKISPFVAEWLANAVEYCKNDPQGRAQFQAWVLAKFGPQEGRQKLEDCKKPPRKKYGTSTGNALLWNHCGVELGVCDEAIELYHKFTSEYNLCSPPRTKPAPKRRRAENAIDWLARRHEALLEGCKAPNISWEALRAIAISEADKVQDTMEMWRTHPETFMDGLMKRAESTIPSPQILDQGSDYIRFHKIDDAFRSRLYTLHLARMTWSHAASLFEDLARLGLTTGSSIERAYQQDSKLMWRFVSCIANVNVLSMNYSARMLQELSWSEHFRPYFKRWRTVQGLAIMEEDKAYTRRNGYGSDTNLDQLIVRAVCDWTSVGPAFFDLLSKILIQFPLEANKFSEEAFNEIGDYAISMRLPLGTFEADLLLKYTNFAPNYLQKYAASKEESRSSDPNFEAEASFVEIAKLPAEERIGHDFSTACVLSRAISQEWLNIITQQSMWSFMPQIFVFVPSVVDAMWENTDRNLWAAAKNLDKRGSPGAVAKRFGLVNPNDRNRPTFTGFLSTLRNPPRVPLRIQPATTPAPARPTPVIPAASPRDTGVQSGHAYAVESKGFAPKEKIKTKAVQSPGSVVPDTEEDLEETPEPEYPDVLPLEFKIGKKVMKLFHRILEDGPEDDATNSDQKKGQVRWGDFERAMKRVGFEVVQTTGSSVRFDPPAQTARPISFHRPHPDSILTRRLIKWAGARLKRCYGWTTGTFTQSQGE